MNIKLGTEEVRIMSVFSHITKINARDCLSTDDSVYFLVDPEKIGLAIGKNGETVKEVSRALRKQVKLFSYADNAEGLIKNMIPDIKNIKVNNGSIFVSVDKKNRSTVIGKNGSNIKVVKEFLKRHFGVKNFKLWI